MAMDKLDGRWNSAKLKRREVVGTVSGALAAGTIPSISAANEGDEISLDTKKTRVISLHISSELDNSTNGDPKVKHSCDWIPSYYIGMGRAFNISSASGHLTRNDVHVVTPTGILGDSKGLINVSFPLLASGDYHQLSIREWPDLPENKVDGSIEVNESSSTIRAGERELRLDEGDQGEVKLAEIELDTYEMKDIQVEGFSKRDADVVTQRQRKLGGSARATVILHVNDWGEIPVYASEWQLVFPQTMPGADLLRKNLNQSDRATIIKEGDDLVVAEVSTDD